MLRTIVDLTFLLLAIVIITVLLKDNHERTVIDSARNDVAIVKQDMDKVIANNVAYFEGRQNKAEERQDNYQSSTSRRLYVLEQRLEILEQSRKDQSRVVNNNINNNSITNR